MLVLASKDQPGPQVKQVREDRQDLQVQRVHKEYPDQMVNRVVVHLLGMRREFWYSMRLADKFEFTHVLDHNKDKENNMDEQQGMQTGETPEPAEGGEVEPVDPGGAPEPAEGGEVEPVDPADADPAGTAGDVPVDDEVPAEGEEPMDAEQERREAAREQHNEGELSDPEEPGDN
jgi:hypothetical protein